MPGEESIELNARGSSACKTDMQDACKFAVAAKLHKDTFTERQTDEVKRFLDPVGGSVHVEAANGRAQAAGLQTETETLQFSRDQP